MKITIKEREIELKYGFRPLLVYERITGETFVPTSLNSIVVFFYASIVASDKDLVFSFNEYLDWLDENPTSLTEFSQFLIKKIELNNYLSNDSKEEKKFDSKKEDNSKKKQ